jgi:CubicO group peptidase (beta-lactamase class C family)
MFTSNRFRSIQILSVIIIFLFTFQGAIFAQSKIDKIDELIQAYHDLGQFNGTALVAENGKVIYQKGFGMANIEWNIPNKPDTKFRLGSVTKQFTAMLILQLVAEGKIDLEGKLADYLPYYRKDVGEKVTVHHLLTHTSGIPSYTGLPNFFQDISRDPYGVDEFVQKYCSGDLEFEPGSKFAYNNSGYFLLGAIIEKVTGETYEEMSQERIFKPLGMKNSGYDHHDTIIPNRATGYARTFDGYTNSPYLDMSLPYAAGSLYSTVEDLYIWDQALYLNIIVHGGGINGFNTLIDRMVDERHLVVLLNNSPGASLGNMSTAITRILYGEAYDLPKQSIAEAIYPTLVEKGVEAAVEKYRGLKKAKSKEYIFQARELNRLGYYLLHDKKRIEDAIAIFKFNIEMYPKYFNAYDSLAEAYMVKGDKDLAIKNYAKSLELNPKNINAIEKLNELVKKK